MENLSIVRDKKSKYSRRRKRLERGGISIMTAISLPVIIGVLVLAIDVSYALAERNNMQGAADNAARAAAELKSLDGATLGMIKTEAYAVAAAHGYYDRTFYGPTKGNADVVVYAPPITGNFMEFTNAVEVRIDRPSLSFFGSAFGMSSLGGKTRAVGAFDFLPCLLALSEEDKNGVSGITVSGSTPFEAPCSVWSNRKSQTASVSVNGSAKMTTSSVYMNGSTDAKPDSLVGARIKDAGVYRNPFAGVINSLPNSLTAPGPGGGSTTAAALGGSRSLASQCNATSPNATTGGWYDSSTKTLRLVPGYYAEGIKLGGSSFAGACSDATKVVLEPGGAYYLDSDFYLNITDRNNNPSKVQSVVAEGLTLVLLGTADISVNGGTLIMSPPATGPLANITLISGEKSYSKGGSSGFTSASINLDITGNVVLPYKNFNFNGNLTSANKCLTLIGNSLSIAGVSGTLGGGCPSNRATQALERTSRLAE